jgi:hypothetical protein
MADKTLPAPLALVIQGRRGRVRIRVRSLMLLQVTHRGKIFSAQSTSVLPLEGHGGRNPSRTTRPSIQGWRGPDRIRMRLLMIPQVAHRGKVFSAHCTTVLPLAGHGGQNPSRTTRTCDPGMGGALGSVCVR